MAIEKRLKSTNRKVMFQQIKKYFQSSQAQSSESACPNCWGRQEYQDEFRETFTREEITLNNVDRKKGWVEAYASKFLYGIKFQKKGNKIACPSCHLSV